MRYRNSSTGAVVSLDYAPAGEDWRATTAAELDSLAAHPEECGPCPACSEALDEPELPAARRDSGLADRREFWRRFRVQGA